MEITYINVALVPIILGVVSAIKSTGLDTRWAPVISVVLGVLVVGFLGGFDAQSLLMGIGTGLAASGLYSGAKVILTSVNSSTTSSSKNY